MKCARICVNYYITVKRSMILRPQEKGHESIFCDAIRQNTFLWNGNKYTRFIMEIIWLHAGMSDCALLFLLSQTLPSILKFIEFYSLLFLFHSVHLLCRCDVGLKKHLIWRGEGLWCPFLENTIKGFEICTKFQQFKIQFKTRNLLWTPELLFPKSWIKNSYLCIKLWLL